MSQHAVELKIFAGNSNPPLAEEISQYLKVPLGKAVVETFSDGESKVEIQGKCPRNRRVCFAIHVGSLGTTT